MRKLIFTFAVGMVVAAAPSSAQTYDPSYAFCRQVNSDAPSIDCLFTSMEQCKESVGPGISAQCIQNPYFRPEQPAPAAQAASNLPAAPPARRSH